MVAHCFHDRQKQSIVKSLFKLIDFLNGISSKKRLRAKVENICWSSRCYGKCLSGNNEYFCITLCDKFHNIRHNAAALPPLLFNSVPSVFVHFLCSYVQYPTGAHRLLVPIFCFHASYFVSFFFWLSQGKNTCVACAHYLAPWAANATCVFSCTSPAETLITAFRPASSQVLLAQRLVGWRSNGQND